MAIWVIRLVYGFAKRCWAVVKGRKVHKAHYEDVPAGNWPKWVGRRWTTTPFVELGKKIDS